MAAADANPSRNRGRPYVRKISSNMEYTPVEILSESIVRPGIDKHLIPLLLYRGSVSVGRAHRLWNFVLTMKEQGCESIYDGLALSHNPLFSHLCGPDGRITRNSSLSSFLGRMEANRKVTDNIPGLTDYLRSLDGWRRNLIPVSIEGSLKSHSAPRVPWRIYPRKVRFVNAALDKPISARDAIYPYIMHDGKTDAGVDLVKEVNRLVPRSIPPEFRGDVCQDIICAVLAGETTLAELEGADVRKFVATARSVFSSKWDHISIDDAGDDFRSPFLDTFDAETMAAVH